MVGGCGCSVPVRRASSAVSPSIAGLWKATSVFTARTTVPAAAQSAVSARTSSAVPEMTVEDGAALIAATTSVRPARRCSVSAKDSATRAMAPLPCTARNPRAR